MIAADGPSRRPARLLCVGSGGTLRDLPREALQDLFRPGDLVVANDAATLPASLGGRHERSGMTIEIRLAGWIAPGDPTQFAALAFGGSDRRLRTEERPPPPPLRAGDRLRLGALTGVVEALLDHARLFVLRLGGGRGTVLAGLARHGQPIQYAHVTQPLALWDVWTCVAAVPAAFEAPSAGLALTWHMIAAWRRRGVGFATLTHAAGISSTGDAALDRRLPFDEPYVIPERTAAAIAEARATGARIIAIGTTVVRALEAAAADGDGDVRAGPGMASGRIEPHSQLRIVDAVLSGVHQPGESHFELLRAFADAALLERTVRTAADLAYLGHEFGDSVLLERRTAPTSRSPAGAAVGA